MRMLLALVLMLMTSVGVRAEDRILVFAPASMTDVLQDAAAEYSKQGGPSVVFSFAGTQHLARQLDAGAPAHVYITADRDWMDWAIERDLVDRDMLVALAGNRLVIAVRNEVENWVNMKALLTRNRFAMAEPNSVPAGRYARQALEKQGLWAEAKHQAVFTDNVRTTLRRLARGEVSSAIVYATDAEIEPDVRPLFILPASSHDPIVYWMAQTRIGIKLPAVSRFLNFLESSAARRVFSKAGFQPPPSKTAQ